MIDQKKSFVSVYKNAKNELVIEFQPQDLSLRKFLKFVIKSFLSLLVKIFTPIFAILDFLATKKQLVLSSVGLGIGLALSVLISQRPDALFAFPPMVDRKPQVYTQKMEIEKIDLSVPVELGTVQDILQTFSSSGLVHDERSAGLSSGVSVIFDTGVGDSLEQFDKVRIGDRIELTGTNEAKYIYSVTEIRTVDSEYLPNVVGLYDEAVIIYKPLNLLRTRLYIVIAQPLE